MSCHTFCRYCTCHWIPPPSPQHQRWGCLPVSAGNSSLCSYPLLLPRSRGLKPPQSLLCPDGRSSTSQAQWCFEHLPHHVHLQNSTEHALNIWYDNIRWKKKFWIRNDISMRVSIYLLLPKLSWSVWVRIPFLTVEPQWQEEVEMWRDDCWGLIMLGENKHTQSAILYRTEDVSMDITAYTVRYKRSETLHF